MTVNLLRMAVGIESVEQLREVQEARKKARRRAGERAVLMTFTRNTPRRSAELIDGGSIYWVVKRFIRLRQPIVGVEKMTNAEGRHYSAIELAPSYILTELRPQKAFQGWRYLRPEDAPGDIERRPGDSGDLPLDMAEELRDLGLL